MASVVRVLPNVSGLEKLFDYSVPEALAGLVNVGSLVRVELNGRRVAGWVVELDPPADDYDLKDYDLKDIAKLSSVGPPAEVVELTRWAAERWCGRWSSVMKAASPPTMVDPRRTAAALGQSLDFAEPQGLVAEALGSPGVTTVRIPPSHDALDLILAASARGNTIVATAEVSEAAYLAAKLRRSGARVSLLPGQWEASRGGGIAVGARSAVWAPVPDVKTVIVVDEHSESLQEERNPTWHARDVAIERSLRAGAQCVLVSPSPTPSAVYLSDRVAHPSRSIERSGWPLVRIADRRQEDPGRTGLFSPQLVDLLRGDKRVVCVLNRKGRAVMLACARCGELVRTEDGEHLMTESDEGLVCQTTGETRARFCSVCASTKLKRLRLGIGRAREELEALAGEPVGEVSANRGSVGGMTPHRILVGTTAVLYQVKKADSVAFLDFDQELLAPRYKANEQAMSLLVTAARLVGPRSNGGTVLVQTRNPDHRVLAAAVRSDPGRYIDEELKMRESMGFPPFGVLAEVSGSGAEEFLAPLRSRIDPIVMGPRPDGRYLVRSETSGSLSEAIGSLPRPKKRVRVSVDPPRA